MKRLLLALMLILTAFTGYAQEKKAGYVTTKDRVVVYSKPSYKSKVAYWDGQVDRPTKVVLSKGEVLDSDGRKSNGFVYVFNPGYHSFFEGWVPLSAVRAAKKCSACNGTGLSDTVCSSCDGDGCGICGDDGYEACENCNKYGYVK